MHYSVLKPSYILSPYVKQYWTMENNLPSGKEYNHRIIPSGLFELIFYFDDRPISADSNISLSENTLITGQLSKFYDLRIAGKLSLFSIIFQPCGLSVFFDLPTQELLNQNVPLKYILREEVNQLEQELAAERTFQKRKSIAERFLFNRLRAAGNRLHYKRIHHSIRKINQYGGNASIDELAMETCLSRKQFERKFSEIVGITPKKFMKTVRFQHAIDQRAKDSSINLTDLTYRSGFYDQSHMTNEFLTLAGMSPKAFFNNCEPFSDYFN